MGRLKLLGGFVLLVIGPVLAAVVDPKLPGCVSGLQGH
jgi:hypothetical protein